MIEESRLLAANNIYDFFVELHQTIAKVDQKDLSENLKHFFDSSPIKSMLLKSAEYLISTLSSTGRSTYYKEWIKLWIDEYKKYKSEELVFIYQTLFELDKSEFICKYHRDRITKIGPLNTNIEKGFFFTKKPKAYYDDMMYKNKINHGRQVIAYTTPGKNDFRAFDIVPVNDLSGFQPTVKEYKMHFSSEESIKIAFIPVNREMWIKCKYLDDMANVEYLEHKKPGYLAYFTAMLSLADASGANIVIFPEISMFPNEIQNIEKRIKDMSFQLKNIKLIFAGSVWENNYNTAYLISSAGNVLIRHNKKERYVSFNKTLEKDVVENIFTDLKLELIDIENIGRIGYIICKDFITEKLKSVFCRLEVDFLFVSSYTSGTYEMQKMARAYSANNAVTTIVCNACSAIDEGFICLATNPCLHPKKRRAISYNENLINRDNACNNKCNECLHTLLVEKNIKN